MTQTKEEQLVEKIKELCDAADPHVVIVLIGAEGTDADGKPVTVVDGMKVGCADCALKAILSAIEQFSSKDKLTLATALLMDLALRGAVQAQIEALEAVKAKPGMVN